MSATPESMDDGAKRWLAFLAVTAASSVVFVVYAVVKTLSSPEQSVIAPQQPAPASAVDAPARSEPDWHTAQAVQGSQTATAQADLFAAQDAVAARAAAANDPVARQKAVHQQAEYLRNLI